MTERSDGGRQLRARYAFGGATAQLQRMLPLAPDEQVLFHGVMRMRGHGLLPRPAILRLTWPRLIVLAHFAFRPDQVWDLPRSAVHGVEIARGKVQIAWTDQHTVRQVMQLSRWTGRAAPDRPVSDAHEAAELLSGWLAGRDYGDFRPPNHEPH